MGEQKEKRALKEIEGEGLDRITSLIRILRGEGGCPWDRKQTPDSTSRYLIEEAHELLDAVLRGNPRDICEESGDVLFLILFLLEQYRESGDFDLEDVVARNTGKMVGRHPHVFENKDDDIDADTVKKNWEQIKSLEKKEKKPSVLDTIPTSMPALMRAYKVSDRTAALGFDWDDMDGVIEKVEEEWQEFKEAMRSGNKKQRSLEFGDILFTMTNVARFAGIHPEEALAGSIAKFEQRYRFMEQVMEERKATLEDMERDDIDKLWNRAKEETD